MRHTIDDNSDPRTSPELARSTSKSPTGTSVPRIHTVSHTLEEHLAERVRQLAFHTRVSESAVIEFALASLLTENDETMLGKRLRDSGASLRRKVQE